MPRFDSTMIGRRPKRSDSTPKNGAHPNCMTANTVPNTPTTPSARRTSPCRNCSTSGTKTGAITPSAIMSSATVMKMKINAACCRGEPSALAFLREVLWGRNRVERGDPELDCAPDSLAIAGRAEVEQKAAVPGKQHGGDRARIAGGVPVAQRARLEVVEPVLYSPAQEAGEPLRILQREPVHLEEQPEHRLVPRRAHHVPRAPHGIGVRRGVTRQRVEDRPLALARAVHDASDQLFLRREVVQQHARARPDRFRKRAQRKIG